MIMERSFRNLDEFHYFWNYGVYSCLLKIEKIKKFSKNQEKLLKMLVERNGSKNDLKELLLTLRPLKKNKKIKN